MKKACLVVSKPYANGEIFNKNNYQLNRDNGLTFFHLLKDYFSEYGIDLNTQDINSISDTDIVIYNEMPSQKPRRASDIKKSYLLLFESELIRPDNWDVSSHQYFSKIFTWHDGFVDNIKYFKFNFTHSGQSKFLPFSSRKKLSTLIAGNKDVAHKLELYSHRKKIIRWFESHYPDDFEFYGMGWGQHTFTIPLLSKVLNRLPILRKNFAEDWPSYRGPVVSKLETLKDYKFSICFENAKDIPGYITEKILDSLSAGCLPVYWGAPNIANYVPDNCFVDMRRFESFDSLYKYINEMTEQEYTSRIEDIKQYLQSEQHKIFTPEFQAKNVVDQIILGYK